MHFSNTTPDYPKTPEEDYKRKYFEAIDLITSCIKDRFEENDFEMYATCESLLVKPAIKEDYSAEFGIITNFIGDNIKRNDLDTQLKTLPFIISNDQSLETFHDVIGQAKK